MAAFPTHTRTHYYFLQVPTSLVGVPADVVKKRVLLNNLTVGAAVRGALKSDGVAGLFVG